MAKLSAGFQTPRPSSLRSSSSSVTPAARSSIGSSSSSSSKLPVNTSIPRDLVNKAAATAAHGVAKCLDYDADYISLNPAATLRAPWAVPEEDHLAPLLDLPDPEVPAISTASDDVSADSCVIESPQVAASTDSAADSEEASLPEQIKVVMSELHAASGLSPGSKRLLAALAEATTAELASTATARRLRGAAFWGKVRVVVLGATLATVVAVDVALAAYLYAHRVNDRYHVLPPT